MQSRKAVVITFYSPRDNGVEVMEEAAFALLEKYKDAHMQ
jgi:hypothetical protein